MRSYHFYAFLYPATQKAAGYYTLRTIRVPVRPNVRPSIRPSALLIQTLNLIILTDFRQTLHGH